MQKTIQEHKKCWNLKNIRTFEAQLISTGSYKKKFNHILIIQNLVEGVGEVVVVIKLFYLVLI